MNDTLYSCIERKKMTCESNSVSTYTQEVFVTSVPKPKLGQAISQIEEQTMNTITNPVVSFESERRALRILLNSLEQNKYKEARKIHNIDLHRPRTYGEIKQLLKDGKVELNPEFVKDYEDDEEIEDYRNPTSYLVFDYKKPNKKGYREAQEKIDKDIIHLSTQISVLSPEEALKKLESFESKTIH